MNAHLLPYPYNQPLSTSRFQALYARIATILYSIHKSARVNPLELPSESSLITVVCISDTHNATPAAPSGHVLIHSGDLTQNGTFVELQAQLTWLQSLPYQHKIVIAGNHDLLLDDTFGQNHPHRHPGLAPGQTRMDLDWGDIIYLNESSTTLKFPKRSVSVYGSPHTPELGTWAFQYPPIRDVWTHHIPSDTDIVIVHGPPVSQCDVDRKGDGYLLRELRRVKPRLVVCGHVHDGYGERLLVHDGVESAVEEVMFAWGGLLCLIRLFYLICWAWLRWLLGMRMVVDVTRIVNAAVAPGKLGGRGKEAIVVSF